MEVPLEIIVELLFTKSTVLAIMAFESGEVTFETIG